MPFRPPQAPADSPRGTTPGSPGPPGPIDIFDERPADYPKDRRGQPPWDPNYKMTPAMPEEHYKKFKGVFGPEVRKHAWDNSGVNFPYPRPMPNPPTPVQGPPEPPFRWPTTDPYNTPNLPPTVEEAPRADSWEWDLPLGPREFFPKYYPPYTKGLGPYYEGTPGFEEWMPREVPIEEGPDTYRPPKTIPDPRVSGGYDPGKYNPDWYPPLDPKLEFPGGYQPGYHRPGVDLDDSRHHTLPHPQVPIPFT